MDISKDETLDSIFQGKLSFIQKKNGYRFSVDSVILCEFVKLKGFEKILDIGCGCGVIGICLAYIYPKIEVFAVEIQKSLFKLAKRNVELNGMDGRISVIYGDIRKIYKGMENEFDVIVTNPPYRELGSGRINPEDEKAIARHELCLSLEDLVSISFFVLKPKGIFFVIYPAKRACDLMYVLRSNKLEPKRVRFVHSYMDDEARFILVEAKKFGRRELKVEPPLILYNA